MLYLFSPTNANPKFFNWLDHPKNSQTQPTLGFLDWTNHMVHQFHIFSNNLYLYIITIFIFFITITITIVIVHCSSQIIDFLSSSIVAWEWPQDQEMKRKQRSVLAWQSQGERIGCFCAYECLHFWPLPLRQLSWHSTNRPRALWSPPLGPLP